MQQCLCAAAVFVCACNLTTSLPAIAGMTPIHHRAVLRDIHTFGLIVPSICLLHLHESPRDEKRPRKI
jgi:hypothetical protein